MTTQLSPVRASDPFQSANLFAINATNLLGPYIEARRREAQQGSYEQQVLEAQQTQVSVFAAQAAANTVLVRAFTIEQNSGATELIHARLGNVLLANDDPVFWNPYPSGCADNTSSAPIPPPSAASTTTAMRSSQPTSAQQAQLPAALSDTNSLAQDGPIITDFAPHSFSPSRVAVYGLVDPASAPGRNAVGALWQWGARSNVSYWDAPSRRSDAKHPRGYEVQVTLNKDNNTIDFGRPPWGWQSAPLCHDDRYPPDQDPNNPANRSGVPKCGRTTWLSYNMVCPYPDDYFRDDRTARRSITIGSQCPPGTSRLARLAVMGWFHTLDRTSDPDRAGISSGTTDVVSASVQPNHLAGDILPILYCADHHALPGSCQFGDRGVAEPFEFTAAGATKDARLPTAGTFLYRR